MESNLSCNIASKLTKFWLLTKTIMFKKCLQFLHLVLIYKAHFPKLISTNHSEG